MSPSACRHSVDRRIHTVFKIARAKSGPQAISEVLACDQFVGPLHQSIQNSPRLCREFDLIAGFRSSPAARSNSNGPNANFCRTRRSEGWAESPGNAMVTLMVPRVIEAAQHSCFQLLRR